MAQIAKENGDQSEDKKEVSANLNNSDEQFSFYTEDSYENIGINPDISMAKYHRPDMVPPLDFV